jgi:hypothetical protein
VVCSVEFVGVLGPAVDVPALGVQPVIATRRRTGRNVRMGPRELSFLLRLVGARRQPCRALCSHESGGQRARPILVPASCRNLDRILSRLFAMQVRFMNLSIHLMSSGVCLIALHPLTPSPTPHCFAILRGEREFPTPPSPRSEAKLERGARGVRSECEDATNGQTHESPLRAGEHACG